MPHPGSWAPAFASLALALLLAGCSSGGIRYAQGQHSVSPDGLHKIEHGLGTGADVFVRPDTDLGTYTALLLEVPTLRYDRKSLTENAAHEVDVLTHDFHKVFEQELRKSSRYRLVDQAGPDVLLVEPHLAGLQVLVPTRARAERSTTVVQLQGTATLILEVADSRSREVLVRAYETQALENPGGSPQELSTTSAASDARFVFRHWALMLRQWLDQLREIPPLPAPTAAVD